MRITKNHLIWLLILVSVPCAQAHAYLDPGTGSMALQLIVAGVLGALFTLKTWWRSMLNALGRVFGKDVPK